MKFEESADILQYSPTLYAKVFDEFRRLLIPKYPYAVYYVVNESQLIVEIVAVFHTSRNVEYLKKRLRL